MKKIAFSFLSVMLCSFFVFAGCSTNFLEECQKHITDNRQNYFWGETESFFVSFSSGEREAPYVLDGKQNKLVEFGIVTIVPKKKQERQNFEFVVSANNKDFSGEFEASPFDDSYAGDIGKKIGDDTTLFVSITNGGEPETAKMQCLSKDFNVNNSKALEIALNNLDETTKSMISKQGFEIHIKVVADIKQSVAEKFWLVMFLFENGTNISVLINPTSAECEIKKI